MLKIAICDDESRICDDYMDKLTTLLNENNRKAEIVTFSDAVRFVEELQLNHYHIVFLDIDMPEITGLEIAQKILSMQEKPILIFVTNQDSLVYETFHYHPFGFIRKSYFNEEINRVLKSAIERIESDPYYSFRFDSQTIRIKISEIHYFEANQNYVILFTKENSYRYRTTITDLEKELFHRGFIRIHKGFLVNQQAVFRIGTDDITLENGVVLPIGRTNKDLVKHNLMRYLMK